MNLKKIVKIFFIIFIIFSIFFIIYSKFFQKEKTVQSTIDSTDEILYKSNIIENVNYSTKDAQGNEYIINALRGEIDFSNPNIIYLNKVKALIKLNNSENITIVSDYGKYNSNNFDTIFSKNVIINYLENKINAEYLDFSLTRNNMIISKDVIYSNTENILKADVIEINIKTKDTRIFMHNSQNKVNIKSKK